MKATVAVISILLALAVAGLGYGYYVYDKQAKAFAKQTKEFEKVQTDCRVTHEQLGKVNASFAQQKKELEESQANCRVAHEKLKEASESHDALAKRIAILEGELLAFHTNASRNKLEPMIAAIQTANLLTKARMNICAATTSLLREKMEDEYGKTVELSKGRRVALKGTIKDVGRRIINFSQMYLTLSVCEGYDVKFIFTQESKELLMTMKAGETIALEGYVISSGDLKHQLSVGGSAVVEQKVYDEAIRFCEEK